MILPTEVAVVVVGAGPTGLALACQLRAAGVDVLVLERAAQGANTSRAAVVHARTLEVLEGVGVTPRLLAQGHVVPTFTMRDRDRTLLTLDFSDLPTAYPFTLMIPQSRTETILGDRLAELGGTVHRPWNVTAVTPSPTEALVTAVGPDGTREQVRARYVVGADGMHSEVREAAGIAFTGGRYPQSFVLADVHMSWPLPPDEVQLFLAPAGLVVVAPLPGGVHRVVATVARAPEHPDRADVQGLLDERGPGGARVLDVVWGSRFQVHHRVAGTYRRGPILLAGDAAHVHSPAGGQGMNIGIQDAVDLGQTLAAVLGGAAPDPALADYERRRRPVALDVVALTDRATRLATLHGRTARTGRNLAISLAGHLPAVRHRIALQVAELAPSA
jgi:2-polyprenyl-6-methoxyphenol hydroxylase-like FAD-dependent oxidoreductase